MRKLLIALLLLPVSWRVEAQTPISTATGNGLVDICSNLNESGFKTGLCFGYISAASDTASALGAVCYPQGVNNKQIADIVVGGLSAHPEERQESSLFLISKYLSAAFPCRTRK